MLQAKLSSACLEAFISKPCPGTLYLRWLVFSHVPCIGCVRVCTCVSVQTCPWQKSDDWRLKSANPTQPISEKPHLMLKHFKVGMKCWWLRQCSSPFALSLEYSSDLTVSTKVHKRDHGMPLQFAIKHWSVITFLRRLALSTITISSSMQG